MNNTGAEYIGTVINGVVILENGTPLADGTRVRVAALDAESKAETLGERLLKLAGLAQGLPSDFAQNHDHYLHGLPKK